MEKVIPVEIEALSDIYREIYELVGSENMLKFYKQYKGFQVSFPTKLYDKGYVHEVIKKEFNGTNVQEFARRFDYSERWIRSIIAEGARKNTNE